MSTVNEKMTELADVVRETLGIQEKMKIDDLINKTKSIRDLLNISLFNGTVMESQDFESDPIEYRNTVDDKSFENSAFAYSNLAKIDLPNYSNHIPSRMFYHCKSLREANLPKATSIGDSAFMEDTLLIKVNCPKVVNIYESAFSGCSNLQEINLDSCETIQSGAFAGCSSLTTVTLPKCDSIGIQAFMSCDKLKTIYLSNCYEKVQLGTRAFLGTGFMVGANSSSNGYKIYVPAFLYDNYINDSTYGWKNFSRFIEIDPATTAPKIFTIDGVEYQFYEGMRWSEWVDSSFNTAGYWCDTDYTWYVKDSRDYHIHSNSIGNVSYTNYIVSGHNYTLVPPDDNEPV